jgi:hypothetical protein
MSEKPFLLRLSHRHPDGSFDVRVDSFSDSGWRDFEAHRAGEEFDESVEVVTRDPGGEWKLAEASNHSSSLPGKRD